MTTYRALRSLVLVLSALAGGALVVSPARLAAAAADDTAKAADSAGDETPTEGESESKDGEVEKDGEKAEETGEKKPGADAKKTAGHAGQFGLRAGVVGGISMIVRYEKSTYCKEPKDGANLQNEPKFCGHVAPFALDLGLSFAVSDSLEPFVWARLGLGEEQTDTNPLVVIGAGLRVYTMSDAPVKVLIEPAIGLELEDGQGHVPWSLAEDAYATDVLFHLAVGPHFDFSRNVGLYVTGGITTGFVRSLHTTLDLGLGLQGRLP